MRSSFRRARSCAVVAAAAVLMAAPAASAQRPASVGDGVPTGQLGVQMFNYGGYLNNGANTGAANPITGVSAECATSTTPECRNQRLEGLFAFLQRKGLTNIELFAHSGFPAQNDVAGLRAYRALLDKYGLHAGGWHGTVTDVGPAWTERVAAAKILGADFIGSGGTASPGVGSYADTLATAAALNRLGKESVEGGVGPVYIHNHTGEFDAKYVDGGTLKSAWQILMDHTDARYVNAEIDAFWSSDAFNDVTGTQTAALINANPTRVRLLHVKDGINVAGQPSPTNSRSGSPRATGTGEVDFRPIFAAAKNRVQYFHQEHDGGTITDADISLHEPQGRRHVGRPDRPRPAHDGRGHGGRHDRCHHAGDDPEHGRRAADHHGRLDHRRQRGQLHRGRPQLRHAGDARHLRGQRRLQADEHEHDVGGLPDDRVQRRRGDGVDPADGQEHR